MPCLTVYVTLFVVIFLPCSEKRLHLNFFMKSHADKYRRNNQRDESNFKLIFIARFTFLQPLSVLNPFYITYPFLVYEKNSVQRMKLLS